jgi:DNA-binding transcriptional LysR family regulator
LELAMGQPLIERLGRGSRLTDAGRVLAVRAAEALAALAAGEEEIANLAGLQSLAGRDLTPAEERFLSTLWRCCGRNPEYAAACYVPPASLLRAQPATG